MMGTSLLTMPWAIQQAGLGMGIALIIIVGAMCLFTCRLVLITGEGGFCKT